MEKVIEIIKKAFGEQSEISMMRVMSLSSLVCGCGLALIGLLKGSELMGLSALAAVFVGSAFGGKVMQKREENKE